MGGGAKVSKGTFPIERNDTKAIQLGWKPTFVVTTNGSCFMWKDTGTSFSSVSGDNNKHQNAITLTEDGFTYQPTLSDQPSWAMGAITYYAIQM